MNASKTRLDQALVSRGTVTSRSQAENYIKLGKVKVNQQVITKAGYLVQVSDKIQLTADEQYVSRAALKLASVSDSLGLKFQAKTVLDVGSSTGGFTDYALRHGAEKVIAVESGTNQLHQSLIGNPKIELHEKTDIRDFKTNQQIDIVLIDVSFTSLTEVLNSIKTLSNSDTCIVAMAKPQFEARNIVKHKGVIKNEKLRREVLKHLENWIRNLFVIVKKQDSEVLGTKGNRERFYLLKPTKTT